MLKFNGNVKVSMEIFSHKRFPFETLFCFSLKYLTNRRTQIIINSSEKYLKQIFYKFSIHRK